MVVQRNDPRRKAHAEEPLAVEELLGAEISRREPQAAAAGRSPAKRRRWPMALASVTGLAFVAVAALLTPNHLGLSDHTVYKRIHPANSRILKSPESLNRAYDRIRESNEIVEEVLSEIETSPALSEEEISTEVVISVDCLVESSSADCDDAPSVMGISGRLSGGNRGSFGKIRRGLRGMIGSSTDSQVQDTEGIDASGTENLQDGNTEGYAKIDENEFQRSLEHPLSTFSIDVDTASYSNLRRILTQGELPPAGAVRIEELINYFGYDYPVPSGEAPFATHFEAVECPWAPSHTLLRIGLKGKNIASSERPQGNFVFLLDVSGSMESNNKLELVKEGMKLLINQLNEKDRVAIVVYAGSSGLVLPSTPCSDRRRILDALHRLKAGGATNGGEGIELAYATAAANFIESGINRVILCTDGDFNVGTTDESSLVDLITKKAKEKVFLTVLGFGMGNYKDSTLEQLADKGNGNYGYIDTINEAKKIFVEQLQGTLVTIAKDVKIQIEFNPQAVQAYRLIGYENRRLKEEDFNNDQKDAGEIGAGHTVTALYEIIPVGVEMTVKSPMIDPLIYQKRIGGEEKSTEMLTLKLRYKEPNEETSKLLTFAVSKSVTAWEKASENTRMSATVAAFGMLLRRSEFSGTADFDKVVAWAEAAKGVDPFGYRAEFIGLVRAAISLGNR